MYEIARRQQDGHQLQDVLQQNRLEVEQQQDQQRERQEDQVHELEDKELNKVKYF